MTDLIAPLRVAPGGEVRLSRDHDPGYTRGVARPQAAALLANGVDLLADYQDRLAAQGTFGLLLVLQGLDAAGKDSTIKHPEKNWKFSPRRQGAALPGGLPPGLARPIRPCWSAPPGSTSCRMARSAGGART
jgi:hypothetical protein